MSKSISSIKKEKNNLGNGKCQLLDNNGVVLAEFDGKIEEINCQYFVIQDNHLFDIVLENGKYCLQRNSGTIN
jgi:hypothetical protein